MSDDPAGRRVPAPRGAGPRPGDWPGQGPHVEIRTASIRLPGILGFLLAIPAFFLFGFLAIGLLAVGAVGMLIGPWLLRRTLRRMEAELSSGEATVELDRGAWDDRTPTGDVTIEVDATPAAEPPTSQDRAAIKRSSSSRSRGSTSE